jgi:5-formyltetrahydrofolate cyclo-ligase
VVAPGLAFDRAGRRLGYGGGYFDGFLPRLRPDCPVVGVCFAEQLVDAVPAGPRDRGVDVVVTDREVVRPSVVNPHL